MISKNRLWEIQRRINVPGVINFTPFQCGQIALVESLIEECGEDDTLVVSKLRPMVDAKIGNQILICVDDYGIVSGYKSSNEGDAFGNGHYFKADQILGWLPIPICKP